MSKLLKTLTKDAKGIKEQRALIIVEDCELAQKKIIEEIEERQRKAKRNLLGLTDIYPDSTFSTKVTKNDFNAEEHFAEIQNTKVELANIAVELKLAKETSEEWFKEEKDAEGN